MTRYFTPQGLPAPSSLAADILHQHHTLIAGTTGSGKSTLLHGVLYAGHLKSPVANQFVYCDLKKVELHEWSKLPHCIGYADTPEVFCGYLRQINGMIDRRLEEMRRRGLVQSERNHIFVVVDETAELFMLCPKEAFEGLSRIMRLGRCANVHAILCTQSPNRAKGGGLPAGIQQNVTFSVALRCQTRIESRQIIGVSGAELLPQYGAALVRKNGYVGRVEVARQDETDIITLMQFWMENPGELAG